MSALGQDQTWRCFLREVPCRDNYSTVTPESWTALPHLDISAHRWIHAQRLHLVTEQVAVHNLCNLSGKACGHLRGQIGRRKHAPPRCPRACN